MIENLIHCIQKKGYRVEVRPMTLIIRKEAHGQLFSIGWGIAPIDLNSTPFEVLCELAERKLFEIKQAIAHYTPGQEDTHGY